MSKTVYILTLLGHAIMSMMVSSLSFSQQSIRQLFGLSLFQIGLTQCLFYVFLGLSLLVYGLSHVKNHQLLYMCIISIATIVYLIAPICLSFNIPVTALYFIFAIGFGFFQGPCFPITLLIVRAFYDPKVNGGLFGFWSSSGDIGIIIGFFLCTFSVYFLKLPTHLPMFFFAIISIIVTFLIYNIKIDEQKLLKIQIQQQRNKAQMKNIKKQYILILKKPQVLLMLMTSCLTRAVTFGVLSWIPIYCDHYGFQSYRGLIPLCMCIMGVIGSILIGFIFQKCNNNQIIRAVLYWCFLVVVGICMYVINNIPFTFQNKLIFLILFGISGFFLFGVFNIYNSHQVLLACNRLQISVSSLSSLSLSMALSTAALLQLIIGLKASQSKYCQHRSIEHTQNIADFSGIANFVSSIKNYFDIPSKLITQIALQINQQQLKQLNT